MTSDREDAVETPEAAVQTKPRKQTKHCRSWRPGKTPHNPVCRPGPGLRVCRKCWRPCMHKISAETIEANRVDGCVAIRCDDCTDELMRAHDAWIRRALASEEDAPVRVLERLSGDGEGAVAYTAQWQMIHGKRSSEELVAEVLDISPTTDGDSLHPNVPEDPFDDDLAWG